MNNVNLILYDRTHSFVQAYIAPDPPCSRKQCTFIVTLRRCRLMSIYCQHELLRTYDIPEKLQSGTKYSCYIFQKTTDLYIRKGDDFKIIPQSLIWFDSVEPYISRLSIQQLYPECCFIDHSHDKIDSGTFLHETVDGDVVIDAVYAVDSNIARLYLRI